MSWDSNNEIVITGVALRSCLGDLEQTWQQLCANQTGLQLLSPFAQLPAYPLGLIQDNPLTISEIIVPVIEELLLSAAFSAPLPTCGVVIGSSRSCQAGWEGLLSQKTFTGWENMFPYQPANLAAAMIGSHGPVIAPMSACSTGIWAIARAYQLIEQKSCQMVIAGAIDTPISPLTITGFQQMSLLSKHCCSPFDRQRDGLALAEGCAILLIESLESARERNVQPLAQIKGFALNCDAQHMTSPEASGQVATLAIKKCLDNSELLPQDIDLIYTHGTGTILNDQRECKIIESIFPSDVHLASIKGAIGHTLGASGAISCALSLLSLKQQIVPPAVGLNNSAFALNLSKYATKAKLHNILNLSFGLGGQNAALLLQKFNP